MAISNPLYHERLNRFNAVLNDDNPKEVPVLSIADGWVATNAGFTFEEAYVKNILNLKEAYKFYTDRVYMDAQWSSGLGHPFELILLFGEGRFIFDDEGFRKSGGEKPLMEANEYADFMKNPSDFTTNVLLPRKYPVLQNGSVEELSELFYKGILECADFLKKSAEIDAYMEETLGLPVIMKGITLLPTDYIVNFLRYFVATLLDIRRQPKDVLAACEVINQTIPASIQAMWPNPDDSGIVFIPLHLPTYLKPKDFEKFYFPWMKSVTEELNKLDYRVLYYCERDWTAYMDILQDLPEGKNAYMFEKGDLKYICEKIKNRGTFVGGMPAEVLKHGTKQEAIDAAKKCLDDYAPGGKYIFTTNVSLISKKDAKIENLAAANEYIHINGKF
ncbi:MAG: hypothetical protein GX127_07990 [Eubacteriaceae bacterium]|nr:hypothetical protein [Eubacteriaceae bacterium]